MGIRVILAFVAIVVLAAMAPVAIQASLEDAGERTDITNETWTPDPGNWTNLSDSNLDVYYDERVTVYDSNGNEVSEGDDYRWNASDGRVKAVQGGALDGETSANITYGYDDPTTEQRDVAAILGLLPQSMGYALPLFAVVLLLLFLRGGV